MVIDKLELFVELTKYLKKLLTPTLRNSLEYSYSLSASQ